MNSGKPVFQEFVEANQALLTCYNGISAEDYKKQGDSVCASHRERVKDILRSNNLAMSNLVRERIEILKRIGAEQASKKWALSPYHFQQVGSIWVKHTKRGLYLCDSFPLVLI